MNNKRKGEKGKGVIGITLTAIMVASIFSIIPMVTLVTPVSAGTITIGKTGPNTANVGDTIMYTLFLQNPNSTYNWEGYTYDILPNGTNISLDSHLVLDPHNGGTYNKTYQIYYTVTSSDGVNGSISNWFYAKGTDGSGDAANGYAQKITNISTNPPILKFTYEQICCKNISFDGSASYAPNGFKSHAWNFGDGTGALSPGAPGVITHNYSSTTGCGWKTVNLSGHDNQGNFNYTTNEIYVDCGPRAIAQANPTCFEEGGTLTTFDGSASHVDLSNPSPRTITWWMWTFSDEPGVSYPGAVVTRWVDDTITATLEVSDGCCNDTTTVTVNPCPSRVPAITPIGIIALIGLLSVIAAISISVNIRRRK